MRNPVSAIKEKRGMNRKQFSRKSGIPYATLSVIEQGLVEKMKNRTLQKISKFSGEDTQDIQEKYQVWKASLLE